MADLEEQLEHEEQARQKLQLDKASVDQKLKRMEQAYAELDDSYQKAIKEKKTFEDRVSQITNQKFNDEEKVKSYMKLVNKVYSFNFVKF